MKNMKIKEIMFTENDIDGIVSELADKINSDYKDCQSLTLICVLKGSVIFTADLIRKLKIPDIDLNFISASSYGDSDISCGEVKFESVKEFNVSNNDVLVIEDIVDTGKTLKKLVGYLKGKSPKSLKVCGMFDKPERRSVEFEPDYIGRSIHDKFIVGYGLDYAEKYRNLPYVAVVEEETV